MFNNGDSAQIEWILENGGIDFTDDDCVGIILRCERCKSQAFRAPIGVRRKEYSLHDDGTIETIEKFETVCYKCGMKTFTVIISYIGPKEEHPRRKMLEQSKYGSWSLDPDGD